MDCFYGKKKSNQFEKQLSGLSEKVRHLQEEIKTILWEREKESRAYERDMMVFAFKEDEWKLEKKKLKEEVKRLKKMLEEKEEKIKEMEDGLVGEKGEKNWWVSSENTSSFLVEQMRKERLRRDEAVEKWKKLYLAIKTELDDLIQRTHPRDGLYLKAEEEEMIEELLRMEVKAKEETIEELKARLAFAEYEDYKKAREVDIIRQSMRIMSSKKSPSFPLSKPNFASVRQPKKAQRFQVIKALPSGRLCSLSVSVQQKLASLHLL